MSFKRTMAALLALCLLLGGAIGALAEQDTVNELLRFFLGATAEDEPEAADESGLTIEPEAAEGAAFGEGLTPAWKNILLLGTDSRTSAKNTRTDTMIVLSVDLETGAIRLTSLMRDIWVEIPDHGHGKLNAACVYGGPELTMRCVNENFGLDIQDYVLVNMQCLATIVDAMGGIRVDVSDSEARAINKLFSDDRNSHDENVYFADSNVSAGSQVLLNGKQALAFARVRSQDSDYARTDRQREVLAIIARQLQQQGIVSLAGILTGMLQYVETNLTFEEIMALAGVCVNADLDAVTGLRLPMDGTFEAGTFSGTWCIRPDFEENARLLHEFIYGE